MLTLRKGFTLIELLIVIVIIGILAAIAIPKFGETREAAYYSTLKTDLRNLVTAQELYYQEGYVYSDDILLVTAYQESKGVTMANPGVSTDGQSWVVSATHNALPSTANMCAVYVGDLAAAGGAPTGVTLETSGIPACDEIES